MDMPEIQSIEPRVVEVPTGAVAFHHGLTVHMAKPNTTDTDRSVHTIIYFADGEHAPQPERGISPSIATASRSARRSTGPCTPMVWPRPEGDLPAPPPPMPESIRTIAGAGTLPEEI